MIDFEKIGCYIKAIEHKRHFQGHIKQRRRRWSEKEN